MLEGAYPEAHAHPKEKYALAAVRLFWPGRHPILITKRPNDVLAIDRIRAHYRGGPTRVCFLVMTRDPRDQLTSRHRARPGEYYVTPERWRTLHTAITQHRDDPGVLAIDYGELVTHPEAVQARVEALLGCPSSREFHAFHRHVRPGARLTALNGLRPLGSDTIGRWRDAEHAGRLLEVLELLPELPTVVVEEGYDSDQTWTRRLSRDADGWLRRAEAARSAG